ncbi:MAG: M3 family oligoendopeptidase [Acidobacteriota bacterium]
MTATPTTPVARYDISGWDLSELISDTSTDAIDREVAALEAETETFAARRDELDVEMAPEVFLDILRLYERLLERVDVLAHYANLWFAENTQAADAIAFRNRMQQVATQVDNKTLFFPLWWRALDEAASERLLPTAESEPDFRHHLLDQRRLRPYSLDERSEQLINSKDANGARALLTLYSMLTNRLEFPLEVDGEIRQLTDGEIRGHYFDPTRAGREAAYRSSLEVYEREAPVLAQIYVNRVRDWWVDSVELRGYAEPIQPRNLYNDIPDAAVDTLLDVIVENAGLFRRFLQLKAGWLGLDRVSRFDLYAPLAESDRNVPYPEAVSEVLETFYTFSPRFGELAERVFSERHIDSEIRKGKRSGAFCATVLPSMTPWVLLNYTGRMRDVATLAHELGHAVHSLMAADHSVLTQHPSLPLAETASVFAEILMTDRLLERESNPVVRRELLASAVDDVYATVMRQAYFVRFERAAHQLVQANGSSEALCDLYLEHLREQFGPAMEIDPIFRYEWITIPHLFHTPFYCYAYSFGQLLVLALYRRYLEQGEAFKPGYLRLLAHGGAARPAAMLAELDIDMSDAGFWQGGFDIVRGWINELETTA